MFSLNLPKGRVMPRKQIEIIEKEKKRYLMAQKVLFICLYNLFLFFMEFYFFSNRTPLHYAAMNNRIAAARILMNSFDIDVNKKNHAGQTPLERAADAGFADFVRVLLENPEVDVNKEDGLGWTPLHSAASRGRYDAVKVLLAHPSIEINKKRVLGVSFFIDFGLRFMMLLIVDMHQF